MPEPEQRSIPPPACDVAVIGAGIVGLAVARELKLRHPDADVAVLEREPIPAAHQSGHSSGVIHSGIYYRPGSLKARLCVSGAAALYEYCAERGIPARRDGKLVIATEAGELERLDELERRGRANGVPGLERIDAAGIVSIEPHARGLAALHSPAAGVVDFVRVARSLAGELGSLGARLSLGCEVGALREDHRGVEITHQHGRTRANRLISCAGGWADRLAVSVGAEDDPRIVPFRGAYMELRPERASLVRANIYPVPDPELPFLGMHLTRGPDGRVLLGPTALLVGARDAYRLGRIRPRELALSLGWPGTWRMLRRHWRTGIEQVRLAVSARAFVRECRRFVPELSSDDVRPSRHSGVRAQAIGRDGSLIDDFVLSRTARSLHLRNAPSPAATASLTLAGEIVDRLGDWTAG